MASRIRKALTLGGAVARGLLAEVVEDEPDSIEAWVAFAQVSAGMGDLPAARIALQQALDLSPEQAFLHLSLGRVLAAQGAHLAALLRVWSACLREPGREDAHTLLAGISHRESDWAAILDGASQETRDQAADAFHALGRQAIERKDWEEASSQLNLAILARHDHLAAHGDRISVHLYELPIPVAEWWRYREVLDSVARLRSCHPSDPRTWRLAAMVPDYFTGLRVEGAEPALAACAVRWLNAAPADIQARITVADAFYSRRRMGETAEILAGTLVPDPEDWAERSLDDFIARFTLLLDRVESARAPRDVGQALMAFGLTKEAGNFLLLAARTGGGDCETDRLLGEVLASRYLLVEALPHLTGLPELPGYPLVAGGA